MTDNNYALPDLARLRESREAIRYQAIIGSANLYIKALSDELINLNAAVSDLDQAAANIITSAITVLETDDLEDNLQALAALKGAEPTPQVENAIKGYMRIATSLISLSTERIATWHRELKNSVFAMQSIVISNNRFRLEELATARLRLDHEHSAEQIPLTVLRDDEGVLNAAIAQFEKLTFIDRIKPLLEQLKAMIGNKPITPEAAALEAGLIVANKFLDEANELIKYKDLVNARAIIQTRIVQREERVKSLARQLQENDTKTRQLTDTQKVLPHRDAYVGEVTKLTSALELFGKAIKSSSRGDLLAQGEKVLEHSETLRDYLNALKGRWLRG
ncbi:alpha-xenorhabdolysin family binary toxin subunit B [Pseudomonas sp. Eth.TT006]